MCAVAVVLLELNDLKTKGFICLVYGSFMTQYLLFLKGLRVFYVACLVKKGGFLQYRSDADPSRALDVLYGLWQYH